VFKRFVQRVSLIHQLTGSRFFDAAQASENWLSFRVAFYHRRRHDAARPPGVKPDLAANSGQGAERAL